MIKPLRKTHMMVWSVWALTVPLAIIAAIDARTNIPRDRAAPAAGGNLLPLVIQESNYHASIIQLRGSEPGIAKQFVWLNREPLEAPSATIYLASSDTASVNTSKYIGRIETRGNYSFPLPATGGSHFIVYDFIHQQILHRINF